MFNPFLKPRLNYDFSFSDFIFCLKSIGKKEQPYELLYNLFNNENIFFVNHARTGLSIILKAIDLPENSKIGVQAYTCHTVFQAISQAGHKPIFIDINESYSLDLADLKKKVAQLDAIIVTHTFGIPAEFDEIKNIVFDIPIIEDCAHSFLSTYKNKLTGTLGDASIFSFGNAKFPSIGKGGYVLINNDKLIDKFESIYSQLPKYSELDEIKEILKNFIISFAYNRPFYGSISHTMGRKLDKEFDFLGKFSFNEKKGLNSYISLFFKKFQFFDKYYQVQRGNAKYLINKLNNKFNFVDDSNIKKLNFFMLPLKIKNRNIYIEKSIKYGNELGKHFSKSIHWAKNYGYKDGDCPNTERIIDEILTIPCHYNLNEKHLDNTIKILQYEE